MRNEAEEVMQTISETVRRIEFATSLQDGRKQELRALHELIVRRMEEWNNLNLDIQEDTRHLLKLLSDLKETYKQPGESLTLTSAEQLVTRHIPDWKRYGG